MTNVLRSRFDELWTIEGKSFSVEAWVILVFFPEHVKTSEDAVNAIAFTLDQAKKSPHGQLTVYDDKEMAKTKRRQDVAEALKRYMAQERPTLYFQPVFSIATGALYSAEALLRLNDPSSVPSPRRIHSYRRTRRFHRRTDVPHHEGSMFRLAGVGEKCKIAPADHGEPVVHPFFEAGHGAADDGYHLTGQSRAAPHRF